MGLFISLHCIIFFKDTVVLKDILRDTTVALICTFMFIGFCKCQATGLTFSDFSDHSIDINE